MNRFSELYNHYDFDAVARQIRGREHGASISGDGVSFSSADVLQALDRYERGLEERDLMALLSPAAASHLEEMAQLARHITRKRFGNVMQLYAPLYLSNECRSECVYCGFSHGKAIRRVTLTLSQARDDAKVLHDQGIRHILLLTGEDYRKTPVSYIGDVSEALSGDFPSIGIEIYPLKEEEYSYLRGRGVDGLTLYQETYDPVRYREVHLRGVKSRMEYRLDGPDRAGRAGFRRINIGALLGLSDPAADVFFAAIHARHLMRNYWQTQIALSLPRLRPAAGVQNVPVLPDRTYVQYLTALRIFLPDAGLVLSTRESSRMRDHMADICITSMSAGSRTDPGGYSGVDSDGQFSVEDGRSVAEMVAMLKRRGLDPLFVDWCYEMK